MDLIFDLLILALFGRGELLACHSELCRFVSGSYSKILDSSPVMTCSKKFSSFSMGSRRSRHAFLRFSFGRCWSLLESALHSFSACPLPRLKCRGRFTDSNSAHYVKRRSDLTTGLALVTFSSVFDVQVLPERGSFSTFSRPSKNALRHLKTYALDTARSP